MARSPASDAASSPSPRPRRPTAALAAAAHPRAAAGGFLAASCAGAVWGQPLPRARVTHRRLVNPRAAPPVPPAERRVARPGGGGALYGYGRAGATRLRGRTVRRVGFQLSSCHQERSSSHVCFQGRTVRQPSASEPRRRRGIVARGAAAAKDLAGRAAPVGPAVARKGRAAGPAGSDRGRPGLHT